MKKSTVKSIYVLSRGFTLLELLVVMSIVAILASVAIPTMETSRKSRAVESHLRAISSAFRLGRGEAVSRAKIVTMCASKDAETCGANVDWKDGWLVFVDDGIGSGGVAANGILDGDETVLRAYSYTGNNEVSVKDPFGGDDPKFLSWDHRGMSATDSRVAFVICDRSKDQKYARAVLLAKTGRSILSRDLNDDGIHDSAFQKDDGTVSTAALSCP